MKLCLVTMGTLMGLSLIACSPSSSNNALVTDNSAEIVGVGIQPNFSSGSPANSTVMVVMKTNYSLGMCGGLLIGRKTVLTARHCLPENGGKSYVVFPNKDEAAASTDNKIEARSTHAIDEDSVLKDYHISFDEESMGGNHPPVVDLGVIELAEEAPSRIPAFDFSQLATDQDLANGQLVAFGWDTQKTKAKSSIFSVKFKNIHRAQNNTLKLYSDRDLDTNFFGDGDDKKIENLKKVYGNSTKQLKLVTKTPDYMCQGDSGSPLFVRTKSGAYKLAGVISAIASSGNFNNTECGNLAVFQTLPPAKKQIEALNE